MLHNQMQYITPAFTTPIKNHSENWNVCTKKSINLHFDEIGNEIKLNIGTFVIHMGIFIG